MGHCVNHMIVLTYIWTLYIILPHVQSLPTLSVSPSSVVVRGSITFTCTFTQAPLLSADILSTAGDFVCTLEASGDGTCTASTGSGCTGNTLSCSADKMTYSLTVNGVPGTWNGKGFLCRDTLYIDQDSQYATITILVPPAIATITPSESVLCIVEGQTVDLTCTTDATRPQSNITWYRDTAPVIDTTQTVTNTTGDKFVTSSVLTVSGDRNQQGAQIHCTAVNLQGGSPVSSHTKTVNIHYAPNGTLTLSPTNPTLTFGSIVTLTCTLQQDGNPPAGWTWSCPGRSIHHDEVTSSNGRSVLQFTSTKADNGRSCTCRAQSNIGPYDRTSNTAILNVQSTPCSPSDVFIDCSTESIVILSWPTECHRQTKKGEVTYSIFAKERNEAVFTKYRSAKIHITKGSQAFATLNNLSGGEWRFQIETRNAIGSTKSREVSCHITTQGSIILSHTLDGKSVAAGIGVSIGFMCCTGGIIYFVFKRRKRSTETSPKYSEGQLKESQSPYDVIPAEMQDSQAYSELNIDTSVDKNL